jgi:GMP synthase-like glutamine amidotransferase
MAATGAPVLVIQHLHADGPAFLGTWLREQGVPFEVFNSEAGQALPSSTSGYRALAVLGGEMSANDPLPSLRRAEALILDAMAQARPVLGLCLGAQLMAHALGANIVASPAPEVGWHEITLADTGPARSWLGDASHPIVFQWHYEAFDLPAGAQHLASSAACPNQAFALGPHLGLQFHVEVDLPKLRDWTLAHDPRFAQAQRGHASVHDGPRMLAEAHRHLQAQQQMARHVYARWLGLDA